MCKTILLALIVFVSACAGFRAVESETLLYASLDRDSKLFILLKNSSECDTLFYYADVREEQQAPPWNRVHNFVRCEKKAAHVKDNTDVFEARAYLQPDGTYKIEQVWAKRDWEKMTYYTGEHLVDSPLVLNRARHLLEIGKAHFDLAKNRLTGNYVDLRTLKSENDVYPR